MGISYSSILTYWSTVVPIAMKGWIVTLILLLASQAFAGTGKIAGIVVDERGRLVKHIMVEAFPLDIPPNGTIPSSRTDEHGHFTITVSVQSRDLRWRVYPHQEDLYYPDLSEEFYQTSKDRGEVVELDYYHPEAYVQLRLGRKAGVLRLTVTDAFTGIPLKSFYCELTRAEDPKNWLHIGNEGGFMMALLPSNIDITLTVSSQGYKRWSYPGVIDVEPEQELPLDIQLQAGDLSRLTILHRRHYHPFSAIGRSAFF